AVSPRSGKLTVNFTITNLPYSTSLANPHSAKFNATARVLSAMVIHIMNSEFWNITGLCPNFFRPAQKTEDTGVDAMCTYNTDSPASQFDRVILYREVCNKTNGITSLGIYSLDEESLYING
ncbi:MUC16 protein, partial [Baryphthengus martii]|nr:MUC16 protein [Baryphthengus martii]